MAKARQKLIESRDTFSVSNEEVVVRHKAFALVDCFILLAFLVSTVVISVYIAIFMLMFEWVKEHLQQMYA